MSILEPLRINVPACTCEKNTVEINTVEINTVEINTVEIKNAENNTVEKNSVENNTVDSYNTYRTELSSQEETADLEHCVNAIEYHNINEQRRLEIIEIGTRTMKDLAVVCVTASCVLLYLVVFLALARFIIW